MSEDKQLFSIPRETYEASLSRLFYNLCMPILSDNTTITCTQHNGGILELQTDDKYKLQKIINDNNHNIIIVRQSWDLTSCSSCIVALMLILHPPLLRVTVNTCSVLGLRPVIVHGLVVHSAQPDEGGVQLTDCAMLLGSLGWSHCRVTVSHDLTLSVALLHLLKGKWQWIYRKYIR